LKDLAPGLTCLAPVPDARGTRFVVTGDESHHVTVWDAAKGRKVRDYPGHIAEIVGVATVTDPAGRALLVSYDELGTARIWDPHAEPPGDAARGVAERASIAVFLGNDGQPLVATVLMLEIGDSEIRLVDWTDPVRRVQKVVKVKNSDNASKIDVCATPGAPC